jgi:hypothetical protein
VREPGSADREGTSGQYCRVDPCVRPNAYTYADRSKTDVVLARKKSRCRIYLVEPSGIEPLTS